MRHITSLGLAALAIFACLSAMPASSIAATAHNSQAGSMGPTSNNTGPTVMSPRTRHARRHHKHM